MLLVGEPLEVKADCCREFSRRGDVAGLFHAGFEVVRWCFVGLRPAEGEVRSLSTAASAFFVRKDCPSTPCALLISAKLRVPRTDFASTGEPLTEPRLCPRSFARWAVARLGPLLAGSQWVGMGLRGLGGPRTVSTREIEPRGASVPKVRLSSV
jgi:hypothetical protein